VAGKVLIIRAKRASYRLREVIIQSETINAPNRRKLVFVRIGAFFIDGGDLCVEHAGYRLTGEFSCRKISKEDNIW